MSEVSPGTCSKKATLNIQQSKFIREVCKMDNLGAKARGYSLGYIFRKFDKTKVGYMCSKMAIFTGKMLIKQQV
jgi:hypothetical protein